MKATFSKKLLLPKYWGSWLVAALLYGVVTLLPYPLLMRLGAVLGLIMEKLMPYRLLVSKTNIALCYRQRDWQPIYRTHVKSLGKGVLEMGMGWFLPSKRFIHRVRHEGHENVDNALSQGRAILFLGVHTANLDFGAPLLNSRYPTSPMYKASRNPVLDYIILKSRLRNCPDAIEHSDMRGIIKKLKNGENMWYGCDQDFGTWSKSVFAPFYGVPALTLPHYAKIAEKTGAAVIPMAGFRDEKNGQFVVRYLPEINVGQLSEIEAAAAMNHAIEQLLIGYEDQYYWVHRRFKTRPEGESDIYPKKPSHIRRDKKNAKKMQKQTNNQDKPHD